MAAALLSHRQADGTIATRPYKKWQGPYWTLYSLAQLGHPSGDKSLRPLFTQGCGWLLARQHLRPPSTAVLLLRQVVPSGRPLRDRRMFSTKLLCGARADHGPW